MTLPVVQDEHLERRKRALARTSASQINAFTEQCQRIWYYSRIEGLAMPETKALQDGKEIDLEFQHYLQTGEIKAGKWSALVRELVKHVPAPNPAMMIQKEILVPTWDGGPTVLGYMDLAYWQNEVTKHLQIDDLKSTSDLKYVKTPEELLDNTQMLTYAKWGYDVLGADTVSIAHVYGQKKGKPKTLRVPSTTEHPLIVERTLLDNRWATRLKVISDMTEIARTVTHARDLPPSTAVCDNLFRQPCPFRAKCGFALLDEKKETTKMSYSSLRDKLNFVLNQQGRTPEQPAPTDIPREAAVAIGVLPPDAPSRESTPREIAMLVNASKKEKKRGRKKAGGLEHEDVYVCINCGERIPEDRYASWHLPKCLQIPKDKLLALKTDETEKFPALPEVPEPPIVAAVPAAPAALPTARSVPPTPYGDTPSHAHSQAGNEARAELYKILAEKRGTDLPKRPQMAPTLFIDINIQKNNGAFDSPVALSTWLDPILELAARANEVADIRMISYTWKGILAAVLRECLDTCPAELDIKTDSIDPQILSVVLEVLIPHAGLIMRGDKK